MDNVTTDWRTRIWVTESIMTSAEDMKRMVDLKECYVWLDYVSMPQPTAVIRENDVRDEMTQIKRQALLSASEKLMLAAESMEAYISACSFMLVLTPDAYLEKSHNFGRHGKPETPSLYSWRTRGWCMLELIACVRCVVFCVRARSARIFTVIYLYRSPYHTRTIIYRYSPRREKKSSL